MANGFGEDDGYSSGESVSDVLWSWQWKSCQMCGCVHDDWMFESGNSVYYDDTHGLVRPARLGNTARGPLNKGSVAQLGLYGGSTFSQKTKSTYLFCGLQDAFRLPQFQQSLGRARGDLALGRVERRMVEKSQDVEDITKMKELREGEEVRKRKQQKQRQLLADAVITPGLRPVGEPPLMPWTTILREEYSDARLSALFPDDPEKRSRAKDLWGELLALDVYVDWAWDSISGHGPWSYRLHWRNPRDAFHYALSNELGADLREVYEEWKALHDTATDLGKFEHKFLDADGGTTHIEHLLRAGKIRLEEQGHEVDDKYRNLAPTGDDATPLGMFEYEWLDDNNDTSRIVAQLKAGNNIINGQQVCEKYEYLVFPYLSRFRKWRLLKTVLQACWRMRRMIAKEKS